MDTPYHESCQSICPRQTIYRENLEQIDELRSIFTNSLADNIDDESVRQIGAAIHELGIVDSPYDLAAVRQIMASPLEFLDKAEEVFRDLRQTEMEFCVGALRMKADDKKTLTRFEVTVCRSPVRNQSFPDGIERANVTQSPIT